MRPTMNPAEPMTRTSAAMVMRDERFMGWADVLETSKDTNKTDAVLPKCFKIDVGAQNKAESFWTSVLPIRMKTF